MPFYTISPKDSSGLCVVPQFHAADPGNDILMQTTSQISSNIAKAWFVSSLTSSAGTQILHAKNQAYGLTLPKSTSKNCEVGLAGPANSNALIQFVAAGEGYYYIKTKTWNYYLSYNSLTSGSSLFWDVSPTDANKKKWKLTPITVSGPLNYALMTIPTPSTCPLSIIRTEANNITLKNLRRVTLSGGSVIGINGGLFNFKKPDYMTEEQWNAVKYDVISIAKCDGNYVTPNGQENGGSGNLVILRSASGAFSTATGTKAASISQVSSLSGTGSWAQGGAGIFLGDSTWQDKTKKNFKDPTSHHTGLTAFVVDKQEGFVYLIVTTAYVNYVDFRSAIMSYFGLADGSVASTRFLSEFLDGGGSTQLRARSPENVLQHIYPSGGPRVLCEVIALKNTN